MPKLQAHAARARTFRANAQTQAKKRGGRARTRALTTNGRNAVVIQFESR